MRPWEAIIPEEDRAIYAAAGFGKPLAPGERPALLIIDVVESFLGSDPSAPTLDAIREYKTACGPDGWVATEHIVTLLAAARDAGIPVVYSRGDAYLKQFAGDSTKAFTPMETARLQDTPIVAQIAPRPSELIIQKTKASVFFDTPLATYLFSQRVDTLLVAGTSTSGCVRSSVIDAFSHGFRVFPVEECIFDRSRFSHLVNLFEMHQKYGTVIQLETALSWLAALRDRVPVRA